MNDRDAHGCLTCAVLSLRLEPDVTQEGNEMDVAERCRLAQLAIRMAKEGRELVDIKPVITLLPANSARDVMHTVLRILHGRRSDHKRFHGGR